ncbi:uncharacterized protein PG998_009526 [Apiospora kogelbergensis]|uniref:uncharacterized protein n=1 Tax=Apiospora kogelbergensis TaxID=1337665 RepID=UPI00312DC0F5
MAAANRFDDASAVPLTPYSPYKDDFDPSELERRNTNTKDVSGSDPEAAGLGRRTSHAQPLGRVVNALLIVFFCFIGVYGLLKAYECFITTDTTVTQGPVKGVDWGLDFPPALPPHYYRHKMEARKVFNTKDFNGTFDPKASGRGPTEALEALLQRNSYTCRPSEHEKYDYCTEEMIQRWGIYDGMNHTALDGLSSLVASGTNLDCDSCVMDWLENTLNGWKPSQVLSPDTHAPISLPEHLRRVEQAGQTCQKGAWEKIWNDAIRRYTKEGSLTADWRNLPSGDYGWTVRNGLVSSGDKPRRMIHDTLELIKSQGLVPVTDDSYKCLSVLENQVENLPCDIYLSKSQLDSILEPGNPLFDSFCRKECTDWIERNQVVIGSCRAKKMDQDVIAGPLYAAYEEAEEMRRNICRTPAADSASCAPIFVGLHHPEWAFDTRLEISALEPMLVELERQPKRENTVVPPIGRRVSSTSLSRRGDGMWNQPAAAHDAMIKGICSSCVWETVVGRGSISSAMHVLQGVKDVDAYLGFADRLYKACTARGADWLGGIPYGGDDAIWRVQEADGSVSRLILDDSPSPSILPVWMQANEKTNLVTNLRQPSGSIWHLRAAARHIKAEKEGRLTQFLIDETKHQEEADLKVWRHSSVSPNHGNGSNPKTAISRLRLPQSCSSSSYGLPFYRRSNDK